MLRFEEVTKVFTLDHARSRSFKEAFVGAFRRSAPAAERDRLVALDRVSFELAKGETLGLVGPNGTGKSTVLKLIARILEPDAGRVLINGRVAALLELGAGFHPELTGRENVYLNGSLMGLGRSQMSGRLARITEFAELGPFMDMPVKHYSSGMYMRLGFATAIHVDADILLIDEVLAVGDQAFQNKCRERIAALRKSGMTIVLVSHSADSVRELCARALWLERGAVLAVGPTDDVLEAYHRSVVAHEEARWAAEHPSDSAAHQPAEPDRYGSGEIEITSVELLDGDGRPRHAAHTGEPLTVRLRYRAHQAVAGVVFGIGIHAGDGTHVTGPNTRAAGLPIDVAPGQGVVEWRVAALPLQEGQYELSAAAYDSACIHAFDHHHRRFPLPVRAVGTADRLGLLALPARWTHVAGGRPEAPG